MPDVEIPAPAQPSPLAGAISALQAAGHHVNVCERPGYLTVDRREMTLAELYAFAEDKTGWTRS